MALRLSVMEGGAAHSWGPFVTCLPCVFLQAGQTPLETARHHNNPEVALLLTKAPQVGLKASYHVGLHSCQNSSGCGLLKPGENKLNKNCWLRREAVQSIDVYVAPSPALYPRCHSLAEV